ncbi:PIN domain-containing protein [Lentisalinibacter sediminis]|uniref:hypothetical protein n=1 Tax=Lentisalinibacter sediminis TaxID=2992237 RepID=UPI003866A9DE
MNIVDSSAWLEYFAGAIEDTAALVVPSIMLLEVFKRIAQQRDEAVALKYVAVMLDLVVETGVAALSRDQSLAMSYFAGTKYFETRLRYRPDCGRSDRW